MSPNADIQNHGNAPGLLRVLALAAGVVGAGSSIYFLLSAGFHNDSKVLWVLFIGWNLSPWVVLSWATRLDVRWPMLVRKVLYWLMLALLPVSLLGYSGMFSPPGAKPAFVFLVVPLLSWILMGLVLLIAALVSRSKNRAGN